VEQFIVRRDGEKDLKFRGEVLASVNNQWIAGRDQDRWKEITIYKTESGKYVVAIIHRTCWEGEVDRFKAEICETAENVYKALLSDEPIGEVLSNLAKEALEEAAAKDEAFNAVLFEEV